MATLLCEPPAMNQTPSATLSAVTRSVGRAHGVGQRDVGRRVRHDFAHRQVEHRIAALRLRMRVGNAKPPKSR